MADACGLDLDEIVQAKIERNNEKYPVEKSKGKREKNQVQESHDQRGIIKSYRQGMATAGCFSEHEFICMIYSHL